MPDEPETTDVPTDSPLTRGRKILTGLTPRHKILAAATVVVVAVGTGLSFVLGGTGADIDTTKKLAVLADLSADARKDTSQKKPEEFSADKATDKPKWSLDAGDGASAHKVDGGYVVYGDKAYGLNDSGDKKWEKKLGDAVGTGGSTILLDKGGTDDDNWPGHHEIAVVDAATGNTLWQESGPSFFSITRDTVYTSDCYGGQDGELGECQLSAKDARTGSTRWTTPTYASAQLQDATIQGDGASQATEPKLLAVHQSVKGIDTPEVTIIDASDGRRLPVDVDPEAEVYIVGDTVVQVDDQDDNPANGCVTTMTAHDAHSGGRLWKHKKKTAETENGSKCLGLPDDAGSGDRIAILNRDHKAEIIDLSNGKTAWKAPKPGYPLAVSHKYLLMSQGDENPELVLYKTSNGKKQWSVTEPVGDEASGWRFTDKAVWSSMDVFGGSRGCWHRFDLDDGEAVAYPGGTCAGWASDWIAASPAEGEDDVDGLRVYPVD